ncbi:MAG: hypothetical protein V4667_03205 [Bacteroidota bacterium]
MALVFSSCEKEDEIIPKRTFLEAVRAKLNGNWHLKNITSASELDKNYMEKYIGLDMLSTQYGFYCNPKFTIPFQTHHKFNYMKFNFENDGMVTISDNLLYEVIDTLNTSKKCWFNYYSFNSEFNQKNEFILTGEDYYAAVTFPIPLRFSNTNKSELITSTVKVEFDIYPVSPTTIYLVKYRAFCKNKHEENAFNQQYTSDLTFVLEKIN